MVSDAIMSPHSMPSRMTMGVPVEGLAGKLGVALGIITDGTPFNGDDPQVIGERLREAGIQPGGREVMVNPQTGEIMEAHIFFVPEYFQILRHIAKDKMHARGMGPVQSVTRQPTEGRNRDGGYRFGEMELFVAVAHGAAGLLADRLFNHSDPNKTHVCGQCGLLSIAPREDSGAKPYCRNCRTFDNVTEVKMPRSMELFIQENEMGGIALRPNVSAADPDGFTIKPHGLS
jgi:DNA-directed RNA polymerase beta subunit